MSSNDGLSVVPSRPEEPDSPYGKALDSHQRRPNTAAALTGRASCFMLARREAPGDGGGVLVQRTTAALITQESTPTTRLRSHHLASDCERGICQMFSAELVWRYAASLAGSAEICRSVYY